MSGDERNNTSVRCQMQAWRGIPVRKISRRIAGISLWTAPRGSV
jgi:hypothetical protein